MKKVLGLAVIAVALISGCSTIPAQRVDLTKLTPTQVVETYYKSIASGDYSTAKECLSDKLSQQMVNYPDSDFYNIKSLTDIKVSAAVPVDGLTTEVQVTAAYVAEFKKVVTEYSGKQEDSLYVAKKVNDPAWKIISIGTGP